MSSSTMTPAGASTAVASSRSLVSAARECSPSMWMKRGRRPPSLASSSAGAMLRLSAFQVMRRSAGDAVLGAVGLEAVDDLRVGPVEQVDAERRLARRQRVCQRDEEAALEGADLGDRAGDAKLASACAAVRSRWRPQSATTCRARSRIRLEIAVDGWRCRSGRTRWCRCGDRGDMRSGPAGGRRRDHRRSIGLSQGGTSQQCLSACCCGESCARPRPRPRGLLVAYPIRWHM